MKNNKISLGQSGEKKEDITSYLHMKQQKKQENAIPAATKKPQTLV